MITTEVDGASTGEEAPMGSTTGVPPVGTSTSSPTPTSTSTSTSSTTAPPPPDTTTGGTDETSDGETTGGCSCEGMEIEFRDVVEEGFDASTLLAAAVIVDASLSWNFEETTPTTASGSGAYTGGTVLDEVGGCCGNFLCAPCPTGITVQDTAFHITTADGLLDDTFEGDLGGLLDDYVMFSSERVPVAALQGTMAAASFVVEGEPFVPDEISIHIRWFPDGDTLAVTEILIDGHNRDEQFIPLGWDQ